MTFSEFRFTGILVIFSFDEIKKMCFLVMILLRYLDGENNFHKICKIV